MDQTAAVLVGGLGIRLREAVPDVPKPLAPVQGQPFLARLLRWLAAQGTTHAVLLTGDRPEAFEQFVQEWNQAGHRPSLQCSEEPGPLGTGGAVRLALPLLPAEFDLVNGDTLCPLSLPELHAAHARTGAAVTLASVHEAEGGSRGALELGEKDRVLGFAEKGRPGPGWIHAGVVRIRRSLFEPVPPGLAVSLERELIPAWIARGERVQAHRVDVPFLDIGTPLDWARAQQEGWLP